VEPVTDVKCGFACTLTKDSRPVAVVLPAQPYLIGVDGVIGCESRIEYPASGVEGRHRKAIHPIAGSIYR
jgi:hypothetical protein